MRNRTYRRQTHHRLLNNFHSPRLFLLDASSISAFLCHVNMENAFLCYNDQLFKTLFLFLSIFSSTFFCARIFRSSHLMTSIIKFALKFVLINKKMTKLDTSGGRLQSFLLPLARERRILNMFEPLSTFSLVALRAFFALR